MSENPDYEVGYKKPPAHTRWQPGQSGNPRGRPKRERDFDKLIDQELGQTLRINENGQSRVLTKREIIIKGLVNDAMKGDARARRMIMPILMNQQTAETFEPDPEDRAAFEHLMAQYGHANGPADASEGGDA